MSIEAMNWAINQPVKTPSQKLVLLLFSNRANPQTGECWPGVQSIANQACLSARQVKRVISELCDLGLVIKTPRSGGHYGRQTNLYQLQLEVNLQSDILTPCKVSKGTPAISKGTPMTAQGDTHDTLNQREPKDKKPKRGFSLPEWVDEESWQEFEQHRKELKKPLTDLARKKNLNVLSAFRGQQGEIVSATIANGWSGLFPPKEKTLSKKVGFQTEAQALTAAKDKGILPRPGESWEALNRRVLEVRDGN